MSTSETESEQPLLQEGDVKITRGHLVVGSTAYPIRNITSIEVVDKGRPPNRSGGLFLVLVSIPLCLLGAAGHMKVLLMGMLVVAAGVALAVRAKPQPKWIVRVATSGLQTDAITSPDRERVERIVAALHRATA